MATKSTKKTTKKRSPGKRAQSKEAIRKRIVKSALNLFQTKGFQTTTTKAIARKAGIAEGTVFNYFRTKEDIALSFFEEEVDHAIAAVRDNPRLRKAPLEEKLLLSSTVNSSIWRHTNDSSVLHSFTHSILPRILVHFVTGRSNSGTGTARS